MKFKSFSNPLLIVGDNPSLPGGLARICRDLATLACTLAQFRVAVLGRGIGNRRKFPFTLYDYPESGQWGEHYIQQAWEDFAGGEDGIIFTTDDPSRRHWFSNPTGLPDNLCTFLGAGRSFVKWGYFPIDSTGPNGRILPLAAADCINRYDRALAASEWGRSVMITSGRRDADWMPHGLFTTTFKPIILPCHILGESEEHVWVGCVMANQARKDYPAAFECFAVLKKHYGNRFKCWLHTDDMMRHWNVYALASEYGVGDCIEVTLGLTDEQLALRYSACDCTILPSAGEGFGYPIAESLACGTACIVTDYAGGAELVSEECRVKPVTYRVEGAYSCLRAVLSGYAFAQAAMGQIEEKRRDWEFRSEQLAATVSHLNWEYLKVPWTKWLLEGIK